MEYTSDSDFSDDTRDLVQQSLATVKRKRVTGVLQSERIRNRPFVPNMDISHIQHPLHPEGLNGATLTHGLDLFGRKSANGQNYNIDTAEVRSEVVAEPKSARIESSRRAGARELSSAEMLIAYGELEREMN